jgi:ornithine--oxo-acid transaminase
MEKKIDRPIELELELEYGAHNYNPLPVVLVSGQGTYLWDDKGKRYLDMMGAYSAVSHGHCHPKIVAAITAQVKKLGVVSRGFHTETLGEFLKRACELTGFEKALPMNSGAEAVETAIKAARKWGYTVKGIPENQAEILVCKGNFHGRTSTIISASSDPQYRFGFGPYMPGFKLIPYNDIPSLEAAISPNTCAFLIEPIQGEAGIRIPDPNYLKKCEEICKKNNILLICDEIQTGLGRTGKFLACDHEAVRPDGIVLGKALGGGFLPVSLFLANQDVMNVFQPGDHGSTFGGNQLSATVGLTSLNVLIEEKLIDNSRELGAYFLEKLMVIKNPVIKEIRGRGLFIGIEIYPDLVNAREICLNLMAEGLLTKETHKTVIRLAPPLVITPSQVDDAVAILSQVFSRY